MQRGRWPRAWTNALIAIASLVIGAPLAMAAMGEVMMLIPNRRSLATCSIRARAYARRAAQGLRKLRLQ